MNLNDMFSDMISSALAAAIEEHGEEHVMAVMEDDRYESRMQEIIRQTSEGIAETLKRDAEAGLADWRASQSQYTEDIAEYWGEAFRHYELLRYVVREVGEDFNDTQGPSAEQDGDLVVPVLLRLHARVYRVAGEVLALLRAGYGQGAHARWRAMHESVVIAEFIRSHGQETAERYLRHEVVESWNAIHEAKEHAAALEFEGFPGDDEIDELDQQLAALTDRYGSQFTRPYGWAMHDLSKIENLKNRRGFKAIEEAVGWSHIRPSYRLASHPTHANAKSILSTPDQPTGETFLLTGPSLIGLARAGCGACYSIVNATIVLLTARTGSSTPFILTTLLTLSDDTQDAFEAAEARTNRDFPLLREEEQLRTRTRDT